MKHSKTLGLALAVSFALLSARCGDNVGVTAASKSLVRLSVDGPGTAKSGANFTVKISALNIGLGGVQNGRVTVTLPLPLTVVSIDPSSGTTATFSNGISGGRVDWDLGTLASNSQSRLDITALGTLGSTEANKKVTIVATMTGQGIDPGDAVAQTDVTLIQ